MEYQYFASIQTWTCIEFSGLGDFFCLSWKEVPKGKGSQEICSKSEQQGHAFKMGFKAFNH